MRHWNFTLENLAESNPEPSFRILLYNLQGFKKEAAHIYKFVKNENSHPMKKILLLSLFISLVLTGYSQEAKRKEISKKIIENFQQKEYSKMPEYFDQTMKTALPAEKLKMVWEDLNTKCGAFLKYSDITTEKAQDYNICYVPCQFTNLSLKMKVVFNQKDEVAGLFFLPDNQPK